MKTVIVDTRINEACERKLSSLGFNVLKLPPCKALGEAVKSHPDTLLFKYENEIITSAEYCDDASYVFSDIRERCPKIKISFSDDILLSKYPNDCKMNALTMGDFLFCKSDTVSSRILLLAKERGMRIVHVNQGYPACSTLAIEKDLAITQDEGMKRALLSVGIEVIKITTGGISLPPHEYGFIGGASGVFGKRVYFFGDYKSHPDGEKIDEAIRSAGYEPISLCGGELIDLGGMIFLE